MTEEAERILEDALKLDDDDRAVVAAILTDSLGSGESVEAIEAAWRIEIQRRLAALRDGSEPMVSSEEVKLEMREIIERARARRNEQSQPEPGRRIAG